MAFRWFLLCNCITMHGAKKHNLTRLVAAVHNRLPTEPKNYGGSPGSVKFSLSGCILRKS